jgi:hypothetical protein
MKHGNDFARRKCHNVEITYSREKVHFGIVGSWHGEQGILRD